MFVAAEFTDELFSQREQMRQTQKCDRVTFGDVFSRIHVDKQAVLLQGNILC